jgi:hypothetical protein
VNAAGADTARRAIASDRRQRRVEAKHALGPVHGAPDRAHGSVERCRSQIQAEQRAQPQQPRLDEHDDQSDDEQRQRKRRGEVPIQQLVRGTFDQHAGHAVTRAAQQGRDHVGRQTQHESQHAAGAHAGQAQRQRYAKERRRGTRAHALGGARETGIDLEERRVDRNDDVGQHRVRQPDDGARSIERELQRVISQAEAHEQRVERSFGGEDDHPRVGAHQQIGPQGQEDEPQQEASPRALRPREDVGDRIAEEQRDERRKACDGEGSPQDVRIDFVAEHLLQMMQRELFREPHAQQHDPRERRSQSQEQEDPRHEGQGAGRSHVVARARAATSLANAAAMDAHTE